MNFNTFYNKILTDENMMETIRHSTSAYPFRFYYDNLALFDFHCIEWHWHVEFEFVYVEKGTAMFWVGEKQVTLETGQGLFVNSKILHRFYSKEGAVIPNFVFIATFIAPQSSLIYKKYVEPIEHSTLEGLIFLPEIPWQADVLHVMEKIVKVQKEEKDAELKTSFLIIGFSLLNCLEFFVFRKMKSSSTINHPLCGCESNVIQKKLPFRVQ